MCQSCTPSENYEEWASLGESLSRAPYQRSHFYDTLKALRWSAVVLLPSICSLYHSSQRHPPGEPCVPQLCPHALCRRWVHEHSMCSWTWALGRGGCATQREVLRGETEAGKEDEVERSSSPVDLRLRERLEGPPCWSTPTH